MLSGTDRNPCYTVSITDDNHYERSESFSILLDSTDISVIIERPATLVTILNDDGMDWRRD